MSLIARRLFSTLITKGLGDREIESTQESVGLKIKSNVKTEEEFYPLTGTYAGVKGWLWNKTFPQDLRNIETRINEHIGGYKYNLEEGTKANHWYGGVLSGCQIKTIEAYKDITSRYKWVPKIETGTYSIYHFNKRLFSKYSSSIIAKTTQVLLEENALLNSIEICIFKRDSNFNNIPAYKWEYDDTAELSGRSFAVLSDVTPDEELADRTLVLQELNEIQVGDSEAANVQEIKNTWEFLGKTTNRGIAYTEYFPIDDIRLVMVKNEESFSELFEIESFNKEISIDYNFVVDRDSGRIVFNTFETKEVFIKEDLGGALELFESTDGLPETGFVNNDLEYKEKTKYKLILSDQDRMPSLAQGAAISISKKSLILDAGLDLYISYTAYPRIDYEVKESLFWDDKIDVKPYRKLDSGGILEISPQEKHISKILLESDKRLLGNNIYDKLFIQGDYSIIKATVLNGNDKPVEGIEVTFEAEYGRFEGDALSSTKVTNLLGESRVAYTVPYGDYDRFDYVEVEHIGNHSRIKLENVSAGVGLDDFYLFQTLKTDPYYGSLGRKLDITNWSFSENLDSSTRIIRVKVNEIIDDEEEYETYQVLERNDEVTNEFSICQEVVGNYGYAYLYQNSVVSRKLFIHKINKDEIFLLDKVRNQDIFNPSEIVIFKRNELEFNEEGVERVAYRYEEDVDKFVRLKPSRLANNYIWYDNILIPKGSMLDKNNLIAGYKLYYGKLVTLKATATDPATGRLVRSNDIKISLDLPNFLKGKEDGFKFFSEDNDDSSALGFANFITINPLINNQINLYL